MKITFYPFDLQLKEPFAIASGVRHYTPIVLTELEFEGITGYGEASLPPYLGENQESVVTFLKSLNLHQFKDPVSQKEEILEYVKNFAPANNAAKAAVDIALHDLAGKLLKISCTKLLNIKSDRSVATSLTIGIASEDVVKQKFSAAKDFKILKIKLGSGEDDNIIKALPTFANKPFAIDVNQGWENKEQVLKWVNILENSLCQYIEQPFKKENWKATEWLKSITTLPVIADESVKTLNDLENISEIFDGINIKLMKSTGIAEAIKMINAARAMNLKIIIGSMTETTCGISAAAHLTPLADWADLDSQFLTKNDPFTGIKIEEGMIIIDPKKPGTGAEKV